MDKREFRYKSVNSLGRAKFARFVFFQFESFAKQSQYESKELFGQTNVEILRELLSAVRILGNMRGEYI